ncbi:MAG: YdcF family protein [Proteobacteria bacterium]|nr:YdcF family protein [Pseudomonadota bacterium]
MHALENLEKSSKTDEVYDAAIVLSGMVDLRISTEETIEFSGAVDRILAGVALINNGSAGHLIISGGDGSLVRQNRSEAELLQEFALGWGADKNRIIVDADSRNTYENALRSAELVRERKFDRVLLITSAFHMYRARGCFRQVGLDVDTLSVDYRSSSEARDFRDYLPSSQALSQTSLTIHELVGIVVYGLMQRTTYSR